jgi:hypothetical protein
MKVQKRGTNVKRHTVMWKIGGKWMTRKQAYGLAKAGKIEDVVAYRGAGGGYIQSSPSSSVRLYDLDEVVMS